MSITVIFKNGAGLPQTHTGQTFSITAFEAHNTFGFLELTMTDGTSLFINLSDVFTFQVFPTAPAPTKK